MGLFAESNGDAAKALELMFDKKQKEHPWYHPDKVFICQTVQDVTGVNYFSYKNVSKKELSERAHIVEWSDYEPSVKWLDVWHIPVGMCKSIPRDKQDIGIVVCR